MPRLDFHFLGGCGSSSGVSVKGKCKKHRVESTVSNELELAGDTLALLIGTYKVNLYRASGKGTVKEINRQQKAIRKSSTRL